MTDMEMIPITTEAIIIMGMPKIPFHLGGTKDLARDVLECVAQTNVAGAYLRNHGLITVGPDLRKAADMTRMVEHTVGILLKLREARLDPSHIPTETVTYLTTLIESRAAL
jgi:ribulose-5-phosphate 4-epimerase/fuculose-1-phosphate aldolase